ncbi:hypothetical protein, partial [Streptomyces verrucosisporus]|uniref:hypothetical protein n=1 Tax=Streptomyces verrucosisporus TaxID=1695161 RepID=UPI0019D12BA6
GQQPVNRPDKKVDIHHEIMIVDGYSASPPTTGQSRTFDRPAVGRSGKEKRTEEVARTAGPFLA